MVYISDGDDDDSIFMKAYYLFIFFYLFIGKRRYVQVILETVLQKYSTPQKYKLQGIDPSSSTFSLPFPSPYCQLLSVIGADIIVPCVRHLPCMQPTGSISRTLYNLLSLPRVISQLRLGVKLEHGLLFPTNNQKIVTSKPDRTLRTIIKWTIGHI